MEFLGGFLVSHPWVPQHCRALPPPPPPTLSFCPPWIVGNFIYLKKIIMKNPIQFFLSRWRKSSLSSSPWPPEPCVNSTQQQVQGQHAAYVVATGKGLWQMLLFQRGSKGTIQLGLGISNKHHLAWAGQAWHPFSVTRIDWLGRQMPDSITIDRQGPPSHLAFSLWFQDSFSDNIWMLGKAGGREKKEISHI